MSFSDLTQYILTTLQAYFGPTGTHPDNNLTVEQSISVKDPFSSIAPGVNQKVILIDAPVTKDSAQQASGQVLDYTDNIRLTLFIRLMSADTDANTAYAMLEVLRQAVIQAVNARGPKLGVANVKLVSAPKPTMSDNTVSDTMTYEIHHFEDKFTGPQSSAGYLPPPIFAIYPGVDGKTLDTLAAGGKLEVATDGIKTANIAPASVTATQVDSSVEIVSHKGVANGYAQLDSTGKIPVGEIPPISQVNPDNITIDQNGPGNTLEVKAHGLGAGQVNSQIEQTSNKNQAFGYPGLSAGKIQANTVPIDGSTIVVNGANQLAAVGGGGGGFPGVDNVTIDQIGGTGVLQVKNNSIGPSQVTPVIEQTSRKDGAGGYPGLDVSTKILAAEIPYDGTTIVLTGAPPNQRITAVASGGYPGVDGATLDTGGALGTIEIKTGGVSTNQLANSAVIAIKADSSIEKTANKDLLNGYPGLTGGLISPLEIPIDGTSITINGSNKLQATSSSYPGFDNVTIDRVGGTGALEVKAGGVGATQVNSSQVQVTSQKNNTSGYCGLDSSGHIPSTINLANASQVPVDGVTVKNDTGVLRALAGGTVAAAYVDYNVLVQPSANPSGVAQPVVVDSSGSAVVDTNGNVTAYGISKGLSAGTTQTFGIQEALNYLVHTRGNGTVISGGCLRIAANNHYSSAYTCTAPIIIPSGSTGLVMEGAGAGGVNSTGGANGPTNTLITTSSSLSSLIQFGDGTTTGWVNGCTFRNMMFVHTANAMTSGIMCNFTNVGNGDEAAGNTFNDLTFYCTIDHYGVSFNHQDDTKIWNCRFYGKNDTTVFPPPQATIFGKVTWNGGTATAGYNSFDMCHFDHNQAEMTSQGMGFDHCTFRGGAIVQMNTNGRDIYTFNSCFLDDSASMLTAGSAGNQVSIQLTGVMFGLGASTWINDTAVPVHVTAIGCNFNAGFSPTNIFNNNSSTINMIDCAVGGSSVTVKSGGSAAPGSPFSRTPHLPAFWGH